MTLERPTPFVSTGELPPPELVRALMHEAHERDRFSRDLVERPAGQNQRVARQHEIENLAPSIGKLDAPAGPARDHNTRQRSITGAKFFTRRHNLHRSQTRGGARRDLVPAPKRAHVGDNREFRMGERSAVHYRRAPLGAPAQVD